MPKFEDADDKKFAEIEAGLQEKGYLDKGTKYATPEARKAAIIEAYKDFVESEFGDAGYTARDSYQEVVRDQAGNAIGTFPIMADGRPIRMPVTDFSLGFELPERPTSEMSDAEKAKLSEIKQELNGNGQLPSRSGRDAFDKISSVEKLDLPDLKVMGVFGGIPVGSDVTLVATGSGQSKGRSGPGGPA